MSARASLIFATAALGIACLLPAIALAQSLNLSGMGASSAPFTMSLTPSNPEPNSQPFVSFVSTNLDLTNATLSLSVNGKNVYQGNVQPVAIQLGAAGSLTTVRATVTSNGVPYVQTLSLRPQDVSLVVEPLSSAPPLYPGSPLVPIGGNVRVVAVAYLRTASGVMLNPATLSYSWTVDTALIANSSGIGKDALLVASPQQYRSRSVSVTVQSQDGSVVGGASLTIQPSSPTVLLYRNDPLLGILFDHALSGSYTLTSAEATLYAAPFSFDDSSGAPALQWFLNGSAAQTGPSITLRPTGQGTGVANISVTGSSGPYATAAADLSLSFGTTTGSNLFGL